MKNRGKTFLILFLTVDLFLLSFIFYQNDVKEEDIFISTRNYGFPLPAFFAIKRTEDCGEAEKIYNLGTFDIVRSGWELETGSGINGFFPVLVINFLFYLIISIVFISSFNFFILFLSRKIQDAWRPKSF